MKNSNLFMQKLSGLLIIILGIALVAIAGDGDITCLLVLIPIGLLLMFTKADVFSVKAHAERNADMNSSYIIRQVRGHYEVYCGGAFICSGDTRDECIETIEELAAA